MLRTGKAVEAIAIRSPVDGYVVAKSAVVGVAVQPGTVLFEVADLSQVWVTADVYEQDISRIHVGQKARMELSSFPGEMHAGKVQFIYPVLDARSRTLRVRLEFKNRTDRNGPRLRPGMSGTVYLDLPRSTGLLVPAEAVVDTGEAHYVFVAKAGGHFEPRMVKLGARLKDRVEILSGVSEGETVVTTGELPDRLREPPARGDRGAAAEVAAMVARIIELCARNRVLVLLGVGFALVASIVAIKRAKLDAIPDLSDPQVIVFTEWMGRSPTLVEDQVTYPIVSKLIGTPHVTDVRGFSMFGMSFVYVDLRGGHGRLLGAQPRARVHERPARAAARGGDADARARRDRHRLGVPVHARPTRPGSTASTSCARSRTSRCATRWAACRAWPRWPAWAATRSSTRSRSIPAACAPTA